MGEIYLFGGPKKTNEGVPVYLVKREHGRGPRKLLYWNYLFPFMALSVSNTKAKECSVSDLDGTQLLLDDENTVTDDTDPLPL